MNDPHPGPSDPYGPQAAFPAFPGGAQPAGGYPPAPGYGDVGAASVPIALCIVADSKGMIMAIFYSSNEIHAADVTTALRSTFEQG